MSAKAWESPEIKGVFLKRKACHAVTFEGAHEVQRPVKGHRIIRSVIFVLIKSAGHVAVQHHHVRHVKGRHRTDRGKAWTIEGQKRRWRDRFTTCARDGNIGG